LSLVGQLNLFFSKCHLPSPTPMILWIDLDDRTTLDSQEERTRETWRTSLRLLEVVVCVFFLHPQLCEVGGLAIIQKDFSQIWLQVKEESINF
jgi:hypothetical protein